MSDPWVSALIGSSVPSELHPHVSYRLERLLGEGGMGVAFHARREGPENATPAVLKVVRPQIVASAGPTAALMIRKEAIALGRLNERVPPTPFVVRFLDIGQIVVGVGGDQSVELPWIAIEYVHGGPEGTTLEQRVRYSVDNTGYAFDCARAASALEALGEGLAAIHEVDVIHRDLTPGNILCSGFGASEMFKIADFGIARPGGVAATFGNVMLGTPGYSAPEQIFASEGDVSPASDVFSLACIAYYILTGEDYFDASNVAQAFMKVRDPARRKLAEGKALSPELRNAPAACEAIDVALARATSPAPADRPPTAFSFASSILPWLRSLAPRSQRASERQVQSLVNRAPPLDRGEWLEGWSWTVRHPPGDQRLIRRVAWDGDGHALAVTIEGLAFWNGTTWAAASTESIDEPAMLRFVSSIRPGKWLAGGVGGRLFIYGVDGVAAPLIGPRDVTLTLGSGDPEDLAVLVGERPSGPPLLFSVAGGYFFRPFELTAAGSVTSLSRLDQLRWLVVGRTTHGAGYAAIYAPLEFEATFLLTPPCDALLASAGHIDRGMGLAAGRGGVTVIFDGHNTEAPAVDGCPDLASAAMNVRGRCWVGGTSCLWTRDEGHAGPWKRTWEQTSWQLPFVSLYADVGMVTAMAVDGAVVEGRAPWSRIGS